MEKIHQHEQQRKENMQQAFEIEKQKEFERGKSTGNISSFECFLLCMALWVRVELSAHIILKFTSSCHHRHDVFESQMILVHDPI